MNGTYVDVSGADVMLPVVHLIPRLSFLKENGANFDAAANLTITFDEQKRQWVVTVCDSSSYVGSPPVEGCDDKSLTMPRNGGSFLLRLADSQREIPVDCECNSCSTHAGYCFSRRKKRRRVVVYTALGLGTQIRENIPR
jgi:hypothetical protein